jgi:hypothetical protein
MKHVSLHLPAAKERRSSTPKPHARRTGNETTMTVSLRKF